MPSKPDSRFARALGAIQTAQASFQNLPADQAKHIAAGLERLMPPTPALDATRDLAALAGHALITEQPHRQWRRPSEREQSADAARVAYITAMLLLLDACQHAGNSPGPLFADLRHTALCCERCAAAARRRPEVRADTCDGCHAAGVEYFTSALVGYMTVLCFGDLCDGCCRALGLQAPRG